MEIVRVFRKIWGIVIVILVIAAGMCIFKTNNDNDKKAYDYYSSLTDEYISNLNKMSQDEAYKSVFSVKLEDNEEAQYIRQARAVLKDKIEYAQNYKSKVTDMAGYEKILNSSLYADEDNFGRLNAKKYAKDIKKLADMDVTPANTAAIEKFMDFNEGSVIFAIMIIMLVVIFVDERDNRMIYLTHASSCGRVNLILKRCGILCLFSFICSYIFNTLIYGMFLYMYGGIRYLNVTIQSSQMFSMFPLKISIWQFFIMYCAIFAVAMISFGLISYLFVSMFKNYKIAMVVILAIFLCEYLLYNNIEKNSALCILHYVNIINVIIPQYSYFIYENWGYTGFIADISGTTFVLTAVIACIGFCGMLLTGYYMYPDRKQGFLDKVYQRLRELWQQIFGRTNSVFMEFYKSFIIQKGFIILILAIYLFANCKIYRGVNYSNNNLYLVNFYDEFSGRIPDEECDTYISALKNNIDELKKIENLTYNQKKSVSDMESAYAVMVSTVEHVRKISNEKSINAVIVKPDTYNDILGERNYNNQESINLICIIAIILMTAGDFSYERKCGMYVLSRTSKKRNITWINKTVKVALTAVVIWGISLAFNYTNEVSLYTFNNINAPVQSLITFAAFPLKVSIRGYMALCQIIRLIMFIVIGFMVLGISFFMDYKRSVALSVVILLPHVLYILKVPFMYYLSVVIPVDFNRYYIRFAGGIGMFVMPVMMIISGLVIYIIALRKWRVS